MVASLFPRGRKCGHGGHVEEKCALATWKENCGDAGSMPRAYNLSRAKGIENSIGVLLYCGAPISGAGTRGGRGPWWHGQTNTPHPSEANGTGENYTIYHLSTKPQDKTEPKIAIATQIMP